MLTFSFDPKLFKQTFIENDRRGFYQTFGYTNIFQRQTVLFLFSVHFLIIIHLSDNS